MKLPLIAACGLLATSFVALVLSLGEHGERSVPRLVTAPGVSQHVGVGGVMGAVGVPNGNSPFAVYSPPPSTPATSAPAGMAASTTQAAPAPAPAGSPKHHHG